MTQPPNEGRGSAAKPEPLEIDDNSAAVPVSSSIITVAGLGAISRKSGRPPSRQRDKELARHLVKQIAGHCWDGKNEMLGRVWQLVLQNNPDTEITPRRLRTFWHGEPRRIGFSEIIELGDVAALAATMRAGGVAQ